jgi:hypothetical protein
LAGQVPCFGIVRNPLAVLASWNSVNHPVQQGHVPAGERIDAGLHAALGRIEDRYERQFYILEWFFERFARLLPRGSIIRYEDVVASGGRALTPVVAGAAALDQPLQSKNANAVYDGGLMSLLGEKLLGRGGAFWEFYSRESVSSMLDQLPALA